MLYNNIIKSAGAPPCKQRAAECCVVAASVARAWREAGLIPRRLCGCTAAASVPRFRIVAGRAGDAPGTGQRGALRKPR